MSYFNIVAATTENTVVTEYKPAEIEARTKQYEYYRDKLLSFKETPTYEQKKEISKTE